MSLQFEEELECPECGYLNNFGIYGSLNVTLDPDMKEKVLDLSLFDMTCERCQAISGVNHDFLYNDMDNRLMIKLIFGSEPLEESDYDSYGVNKLLRVTGRTESQFRIVRTHNKLRENILIVDSGFDDRILAIMKHLMKSNNSIFLNNLDDVYYSHFDDNESQLSFFFQSNNPDESTYIDFPLAQYNEIAGIFSGVFSDQEAQYILIDDQWLEKYLSE